MENHIHTYTKAGPHMRKPSNSSRSHPTVYLASTIQNCQHQQKQEKIEKYHRQELSKWYPGWDPGIEEGQ